MNDLANTARSVLVSGGARGIGAATARLLAESGFNVLIGDMSVVGPRPHALPHNDLYKDKLAMYMQRHRVKPGITGWAQIKGYRGETDTDEKMAHRVQFDLYYIQHWSFWMDLKIILWTAFKGWTSQNAY